MTIDAIQFLFIGMLAVATMLDLWRTNRRQSRAEARLEELERIICVDQDVHRRIVQASAAQATIDEWRAELSMHPEGSPKHTAYLNRLREVSAL